MSTPREEIRKLLEAAGKLLREQAARFVGAFTMSDSPFERALAEAGAEDSEGAIEQISGTVENIESIYRQVRDWHGSRTRGAVALKVNFLELAQRLELLHSAIADFVPDTIEEARQLSAAFLSLARYMEVGEEAELLASCRGIFTSCEPERMEACEIWVRGLSQKPIGGPITQAERRASVQGLSQLSQLVLTIMYLSMTLTGAAYR